MIREIFIPQKIGNHYLIPQRIVSFDIGSTHVNASVIYLKGTHITIERCLQEQLSSENSNDHTQSIQEAIKLIAAQLPRYDQVRTALPSSAVVFKKIKLPFINYEKIKQVIPYEIEPLLPFAIDEATIDCVITQLFKEEHSAEVFVIAVQNKYVTQHLSLFENTGIDPDVISVDILGLYNLYQAIPHYQEIAGPVVLIDLGTHETRIAYIYDHVLHFVRTIPKGIFEIAKKVSSFRSMSLQQSLEELMRFGLENKSGQELKGALTDFWHEIFFTITSFTDQITKESVNPTIIMVGGGAQIKGLESFVSSSFHTTCKRLELSALLDNPAITFKNNNISLAYAISIGIALPNPMFDNFNLLKGATQKTGMRILYKQLATIAILLVSIFGILIFHSYWQLSKLRKEAQQSTQEIISVLREKFPKIPANETNLEDIIYSARGFVQGEEKVWFAFSRATRPSFLNYLLELFTRLDKKALGLEIEQLTLDEQTMTLKAQVKDHQALKILERDLRQSPLFKFVEGQENPNFTMKIQLATKPKGQ